LVGIAIDKGYIQGVNADVLDYFPKYRPPDNDPRRRDITIEHLLTMGSGIDWPQYGADNINDKMAKSGDWIRFILERPMAAEPGSRSNYSNGDAHLLSAILQKATGETALDFGWDNLFQPLGISEVRWDYDPKGISIGSATIYLTPRDMAKLGYLYLNRGKWEGKSIVSADWVRASLQSRTKIAIAGGYADYGYYWWIYPELGLYEAWGGSGQRIGIFPELGIVTVITSNNPEDAPVTAFSSEIFRYITEAAKSPESLPENPEDSAQLEKRTAMAARPKQDNLLPAGLAGAASAILILAAMVWRKRRNKPLKNVTDSH
jgi:CubicO group peptidase (beta-lactamase class C family)